jgi:hypothetical protein
MSSPQGIVLWKGKSLLDGERIMVIATGLSGKSENRKTGAMIQTYILRRDIHPILARRLGEDKSICGDCKLRECGACYVNLAHGPISVFNAFHDSSYKEFESSDIRQFIGKNVRIGSYGEPSAVPFFVWERIANVASKVNGYTHQWKTCDQRLKQYCMASVDSIVGYNKEYDQARAMGWRTFRVRENENNPLLPDEFICPASTEGQAKTNCNNCGACGGLSSRVQKNPTIILHGDVEVMGNWRKRRYVKIMKAIKNKKRWRKDRKAIEKAFKEVCSM